MIILIGIILALIAIMLGSVLWHALGAWPRLIEQLKYAPKIPHYNDSTDSNPDA